MGIHKSIVTTVTAVLITTGVCVAGAPAALAADNKEPTSVVVDGREFGPADGLTVTSETYGTLSGAGVWGTSYGTSKEYVAVYRGKVKAAGNVYGGQRIIKVCMWYHHPGRTSSTVCSSASSNGSRWTAGSEKTLSFVDNLSDNWPTTSFEVRTTRINPNSY